jgi:[acyl-carrier-protein] S-malonyltransferase
MALGILCPGQGGQNPGMLDILMAEPAAQAVLDAAADVLGTDLRRLVAEPAADLHRNAVAQPLLCAVQAAAWAALRGHLPPVRAFAGYSLGELAAYGCAGALGLDELLTLARRRAEAMDRACHEPNGLLAVRGLTRRRVEELCRAHRAEIAIANDLDRLVVGGRRDALAGFERAVTSMGAGVTALPVSVASHTSLMASAAEEFRQLLLDSGIQAPIVPVLAGVDGAAVRTRERAIATLSRQITQTVEWSACVEGLVEMGCTVLLELGPCNGLSRMVRDRFPDVSVRSVSEFKSLDGVLDWVARYGG